MKAVLSQVVSYCVYDKLKKIFGACLELFQSLFTMIQSFLQINSLVYVWKRPIRAVSRYLPACRREASLRFAGSGCREWPTSRRLDRWSRPRGPRWTRSPRSSLRRKFFNGLTPASFHLFSSFQTHITIFITNICEKCQSSIWYWDSNPRPHSWQF